MGCGSSAPKTTDELEVHDPQQNAAPASSKAPAAAEKAAPPAAASKSAAPVAATTEKTNEISAEQKEAERKQKEEEERKQREEEERKQREEEERQAALEQREKERLEEEERKKKELDAKFTELCTEFVDLLSSNVKGEVSLEELQTVYNDNAEKLMAIADQDENNSLSVEETKTLFLKNGEPDMELVMESIDRISMVKEIREKRKLKEERELKRKDFEDACGAFVDTIASDLGDTITHEELQLVCKKPFEKYASVLYEAEVRTVPGVVEAFTNDADEFETEEVLDLTECFKEIAKIRQAEAAFDAELDGFFGELDGMDVAALSQYFEGAAKEVFESLDSNNDGVVDKAEMKAMFRKADAYYDMERLESVRGGLGDAVHEQHLETLRKAKEEFLEEVQAFKAVLSKAFSPIELEELQAVIPDSAEKLISLCGEEADDTAFEAAFQQEDKTFDKPALVLLKTSVSTVLENRLKQFEERLAEFETKLVKSWLKKLDVAALTEACPDHEENYNKIVSGEGLDADTLKAMFVVDDIPQFTAFNTVFDALTAVENKVMKKFDKAMDNLIKFIDEFCNDEKMGKFKRQDVFQVYIDETRVGDFDKRWVKKMLNKPIDDLPAKAELRQLFTNKKTKEPDAKLVKGFLAALKTITDRRRLSLKQSLLLQEADYEAQLLRMIGIVDDDLKTLDSRIKVLESIDSEKVPTLIEQLKASDSGRLQLEQVKPLWMDGKELDMVGLSEFTNQVIEGIENTGVTLKEDEEEVQPVKELDTPNEMVERPTTTDVLAAAEENADAETEVKKSEAIAEATDVEVLQEAEEADAVAEDATDAADVKLEEAEVEATEEAAAAVEEPVVAAVEEPVAAVEEDDDVAEFDEIEEPAEPEAAAEPEEAAAEEPEAAAEPEEAAPAEAEEPAKADEAVEAKGDAPAESAEAEEAAEKRDPEKDAEVEVKDAEAPAESAANEEEVKSKREPDTDAAPANDEELFDEEPANEPVKTEKDADNEEASEFSEFEDPSVASDDKSKGSPAKETEKEEIVQMPEAAAIEPAKEVEKEETVEEPEPAAVETAKEVEKEETVEEPEAAVEPAKEVEKEEIVQEPKPAEPAKEEEKEESVQEPKAATEPAKELEKEEIVQDANVVEPEPAKEKAAEAAKEE